MKVRLLKGEALRAAARKRLKDIDDSMAASSMPTDRKDWNFPTSLSDLEAGPEPVIDESAGVKWGGLEGRVAERVVAVIDASEPDDGEELRLLCATLGLDCVEVVAIPRGHRKDPATYLAPGLVKKLEAQVRGRGATGVVIDAPVSPAQARNLEDALRVPILDREGVILSIFSMHARSRLAKLQVELAHLKYLQPRLAGQWMGLSRQRGARGGLRGRGLGESRLELDRRTVKNRISMLTRKLREAERTLRVQSARRRETRRVALVGYTNAGKSTLMQRLTSAPVLVENKLFSTLETTVRVLVPPTQPEILVSDTVGFVRKLPTSLVASFKSTLEEAATSGLILHVLDISKVSWRDDFEATELVLDEIGCEDVPRVLVLNKIDAIEFPLRLRVGQVNRFLNGYPSYRGVRAVSAIRGEGIADLRQSIMESLGAEEPTWRRAYDGS